MVRSNNHAPEFDEYYESAHAATTIEEQKAWTQKADLRVAEQLWTVRGPIAALFDRDYPIISGINLFFGAPPVPCRNWNDRTESGPPDTWLTSVFSTIGCPVCADTVAYAIVNAPTTITSRTSREALPPRKSSG